MKKRILAVLLPLALLLSGCGSFLNREYSSSEPHSATYFGNEDRSVLRLETYQDLVNGLLTLLADHAAEGTVWLYPSVDMPGAGEAMERACAEVQQETPLGAYAVDYLTYTIDESAHNYSVIQLTIGYRRTAEQVGAMVHTTSVSAIPDLLTAASRANVSELVVQVAYFDQQRQEVRSMVEQVQRQLLPENTPPEEIVPWQVNFYPDTDEAGIVEILLSGEKNEQKN